MQLGLILHAPGGPAPSRPWDGRVMRGGSTPHPHTHPPRGRARQHPGVSRLTFVVQKVEGAGDILHHHAGLQLVEVASAVDVGQDGACGRARGELGGLRGGSHRPWIPPSSLSTTLTPSHLLKHQVKPLLLLKELDQLQDVPAGI